MKRLLVRSAVILAPVVVLAIFALSRLGSFLVVEDPLAKADAIFVLGGTRYERLLRLEEMASRHEFDVVVVNDDVQAVVGRLVELLVGPGPLGAGAPPIPATGVVE